MIYENNERKISGTLLNQILKLMVDVTSDNIDAQIINNNTQVQLEVITPTSPASQLTSAIWFVSVAGTYINFGNVVLPKNSTGIIFKNGSTYKISVTTFDDNELKSAITQMNNFIRDFAVEVDQTFDENSENAISNKTVTPLANVLSSFIDGDLIIDLSGVIGDKKLYDKSLTEKYNNDTSNTSIYKQSLTDVDFLKIRFRVPELIALDTLQCLTFTKNDGTLFEYKKANPLNIVEIFDEIIDVKEYKDITITWNYSGGTLLTFKGFKGNIIQTDGVKNYIDSKNDILKGFYEIDDIVNDYLYQDTSTFSTINGVKFNVNPLSILTTNNTIASATSVNTRVWHNIPTVINTRTVISRIELTFIRVGGNASGNSNANLVGVTSDGIITPLIRATTPTPAGDIETISVDLSKFKTFSLMMMLSDNDEKNKMLSVKLYATKKGTKPNIVKEYIDEKTSVLSSFIDGSMSPIIINDLSSSDIISKNHSINGIDAINGNLLNGQNLLRQYNEAGLIINTWYNVPTKINDVNGGIITKIDLEFVRVGGSVNNHANLIGVKNNGEIIVLAGSLTSTPNGQIEKLSFSLTDFVSFSLMITYNELTTDTSKQKIRIYKAGNTITKDAVKKYIDENGGKGGGKVERETLIHINKPTSLPVVNIIGVLPTDSTDARTPTKAEIEFIIDNSIKFRCKTSLAVQGNATATFPKKGFEAVLTNYNDEELKVQFGGWGAFSEFHLKAYPNDQTFAKDLTAGKLWHQIRTSRDFPKSYIADFNAGQLQDAHKENLLEQALFYTDGFPIELRVDGQFYGVYVWRIKKERDNYMINNANPNHIFLDNEIGINWTTFMPSNWKVRSPKLKGYEDGGEIADTALMTKLTRWWDWFKGINDGTIDFDSTCEQFINVESWVDAMITQQVTAHWDYQVNNILLTSWDGSRLSICYYDGDQTFGWVTGSMGGFEFPLTVDANGLYWRSDFWRNKLYPKLKARIQARYTELRNLKIIDTNNIYKTFRLTTDLISRDIYDKELKTWRISSPDMGKHSLRYSMNWVTERIKKLDATWKI